MTAQHHYHYNLKQQQQQQQQQKGQQRLRLVAPRPRQDLTLHRRFSTTDGANQDRSDISTTSHVHDQEQLLVLRKLEVTTYQTQNYYASFKDDDDDIVVSRSDTVTYLYHASDYGGFERQVVSYAVRHLLDRYLSTSCPGETRRALCHDKGYYQLISLTCLYMAVKLLEPQNIGIESLVPLTNHVYSVTDFVKMERTILEALDWRVAHGPLGVEFVGIFLQYLPVNVSDRTSRQLFYQSQYQCELAVSEYQLCSGERPDSLVALAALWNALTWTNIQDFSLSDQTTFRANVKSLYEEASPFRNKNEVRENEHFDQQIIEIQSILAGLVHYAYSFNQTMQTNATKCHQHNPVDADKTFQPQRDSPVSTVRKETFDDCRSNAAKPRDKYRTVSSDRKTIPC